MRYYYVETPTFTVDSSVVRSAYQGMQVAATVLGIEPVKITWIRECEYETWKEHKFIPSQPTPIYGLYNRVLGIFVNSDVSPLNAFEVAVHEFFHDYQYRNGVVQSGKLLSKEEREQMECDTDSFVDSMLLRLRQEEINQQNMLILYALKMTGRI